MALKVRFFEHSDAEGLLKMYRDVGSWFEDIEISPEFIRTSSERPDFRFIVAEDDGTLVGFIGALYYKAVGRAELGPIAVDEATRGVGIGAALTERMLDFLQENGIKRVNAKVKAQNDKALAFFLRGGFAYEAYLRDYTLKGEDVAQLVRHI